MRIEWADMSTGNEPAAGAETSKPLDFIRTIVSEDVKDGKNDLARALKQVGITLPDGSPITIQKAADCTARLRKKGQVVAKDYGPPVCPPEVRAAQIEAARAKVSLAGARLAQAKRDSERAKNLFERHSISRERYEKAQTEGEVAKAQEEVAQEELRLAQAAIPAQEAVIGQSKAVVGQKEAKAAQREADARQKESALAEAKLHRGYAEIAAPTDGYVTRKNVEAGQVVAPGQWLLAVATLSDVWVVANYKETQIEKIRPGASARIRVDTYPGKEFNGKVESIMAGTGSAFSLFPPENATGNYVKVVQRVPVKIVLDKGADPEHVLRIGMSVEPTVLVR